MKTKYFISFIIISFVIIGSVILVDKIFAQEAMGVANIQYPVEELGNCKNERACKSYCDKPENMKACVDFAEENNLMSQEEIKLAKNFIAAGAKGPGGCNGKEACEEYCNDIAHIDECVTFAVENNLMPPEELAEAKKVQAAIKRGVKPPPCGNKKQCDVYCNEVDHMEECITFGIEAGFIQGKELEDCQKMLAALKKGVKPPPCNGKEACDEYCSNPDNMEVCMNFAMEAGFMSDKEKEDAQKMLQALRKGVKPPACKNKEECDVYCAEESHFEECMKFAEAAGFMTPEEAEMARKTGGKGPGGCKGKEECESFCNNPDNQETCFNFAKENGMIPEEDLKMMEEGKQKFKESLEQAPPVVLECLNSQLGTEMMEKFKSGTVMPPREIGDQMRTCFEKVMGPAGPDGQGGPGAGGMMPPAGQAGPGGCKTADECKTYCESHPEECQNFQQPPMPGGPGPSGPGGAGGPGPEGQPGGEQFAPGTGPASPEGQPGEFPPIGPGDCQTPEECQQMQIPPGSFQPPSDQQPPMNNIAPPLPSGETPPPPTETPPPPPSSTINPKSLFGSLLNLFLSIFKH